MRICLISDKKTNPGFFQELKESIEKEVLDAEVEEILVYQPEDIPLKVKKLSEKAKAIFVYSEMEKELKPAIIGKIIDLEMENKTTIIKAIKEIDSDEEEKDEKEIVKEYTELIVERLFKE